MKKLIPYLVIVLLLGVILWLAVKPHNTSNSSNEPISSTTAKVNEYVDTQGKTHTVYEASKNTVSRADVRNPNIPLGIVDTSAMLLKIARTQIIQVNQYASATKDSLLQAKYEINALKQRIVRYQDKYVDLTYTPNIDSAQAGTFTFGYNNEVTVTQYHKRAKVLGLPLGAQKSYIDITSNDPRTKINGLKSLSIEQESPVFGLRIQASGNYNPQSGNLGLGPAVRLDLGRLSVQGNYLYYPSIVDPAGRWRPGVIANYDLIRF